MGHYGPPNIFFGNQDSSLFSIYLVLPLCHQSKKSNDGKNENFALKTDRQQEGQTDGQAETQTDNGPTELITEDLPAIWAGQVQ